MKPCCFVVRVLLVLFLLLLFLDWIDISPSRTVKYIFYFQSLAYTEQKSLKARYFA